MEFIPALFSTHVQAGHRTFFVDVKSKKNQAPYLKITLTERQQDGTKKKDYLVIENNEVHQFAEALNEACGFITSI
jgi:hypothetical protein